MEKLFAAGSFLKYRLHGSTKHDIHSPFVYDLFTNTILDKTPYYGMEVIEAMRAKLLLNRNKIEIKDFGTGANRTERICDVAASALQPKKYAQLLFRLSNRFRPGSILELGTSLGISTMYLALPDRSCKVITLEGSPEIAALAEKNFKKMKLNNIEIFNGPFDSTIDIALEKTAPAGLVYFDGNHRKAATLNYFSKCLEWSDENSIFIFDDIHWSREMTEAWEEIKNNDRVTLTIDLFKLGLVFFRKSLEKQHFILKF